MVKITRLYGLAIMLLALAFSCVAGTASAATFSNCGSWNIVPSANTQATWNLLDSITAISANDIWAVGYNGSYNGFTDTYQTLTEHWDGTAWSIVDSPNLEQSSYLEGVTALATNDVWAVGYSANAGGDHHPLAEHWNGSTWSIVSTPNPNKDSSFWSVTANATNDVWAVGTIGGNQGLVEHWNGSQWSVVTNPFQGLLLGVTAITSNDVWAVGQSFGGQSNIEHWNGTQWSFVKNPVPGAPSSISAGSTKDVWAVGAASNQKTLTERWNGKRWKQVQSASPGASVNVLNGVAVISSKNVWTVGTADSAALIEQWNGKAWHTVPSPTPSGASFYTLHGVAHVPGTTQLWAAGTYNDANGNIYTLIESYC